MPSTDHRMYTLCSHCQTAQEVTREMLVPTRGELACSHCGRLFDALESLSRDPAPGHPIARRKAPPDDIQPSLFANPPEQPAPAQERTGLDAPPRLLMPASIPAPKDLPIPAAAPQPPAAPGDERSDPIAEVLVAHADFIEPAAAPEDPVSTPDAALDEVPQAPDDPFAWATHDTALQSPASESGTPDEVVEVVEVAVLAQGTPSADVARHPGPVIDLRDALEMTIGAPAPSFIPNLPTPNTRAGSRRWPGLLAVIGLLLLLGIQSLVAERAVLAADARWRPWLERACGTLGCTLPAWREPAAMNILTRDVRPHPSMPEALIISASFRNDARWSQPWPRLDLTLSDINGQPIARRRFTPEEYLGHLQSAPLIQPGQSASIALEVRDPGKQAVAFEFGFL